jgi:hypothetical protein
VQINTSALPEKFFGLLGSLPRAPSDGALQGRKLVAETGADGDLVTALGAAAAKNGCTCLGLHAGEKAVGLGAVAAVGLKGTLRHDKNSCGRRRLLLKLLAIAAISEYTRWDGIFTAQSVYGFWESGLGADGADQSQSIEGERIFVVRPGSSETACTAKVSQTKLDHVACVA